MGGAGDSRRAEPRGSEDYAELATPPYRSVNPLLISTDYGFRSQDAVGWNPRRFRFAGTAAEFSALEAIYRNYVKTTARQPAAEDALAKLRRHGGGKER